MSQCTCSRISISLSLFEQEVGHGMSVLKLPIGYMNTWQITAHNSNITITLFDNSGANVLNVTKVYMNGVSVLVHVFAHFLQAWC